MSAADAALQFLLNWLSAFDPRYWLLWGDAERRQHVPGMGSLLAATVVLFLIGLVAAPYDEQRRRWRRFLLYGLATAAVPAAVTLDRFHTLRLIAVPIFVLAFAIEGIAWLASRQGRAYRVVLLTLAALTLAQGAFFRWQFHHGSAARLAEFDAGYPRVFAAAVGEPQRPIHILDASGAPGYILAYWYATLAGIDTSTFVRLQRDAEPPPGSLVISTEIPCRDCEMILHQAGFRVYRTR